MSFVGLSEFRKFHILCYATILWDRVCFGTTCWKKWC